MTTQVVPEVSDRADISPASLSPLQKGDNAGDKTDSGQSGLWALARKPGRGASRSANCVQRRHWGQKTC